MPRIFKEEPVVRFPAGSLLGEDEYVEDFLCRGRTAALCVILTLTVSGRVSVEGRPTTPAAPQDVLAMADTSPSPRPAPSPDPPPPSSNPTSPAPLPIGTFLRDAGTYAVPLFDRPPLHQPVVDPTFGTTITRLTDAAMTEDDPQHPALGLRHEYARYPALNADHTKLLVRVLGGAYRGFFEVRELATGALIHRLSTAGEPEGSWHPTDPDLLFYRSGNEVGILSLRAGQSATLMSFPQYHSISTREEGRPSDDWRYFAFIGYHDSSFSSADLVVADLVEKRILATLPDAGIPDWISMSPSGRYVVAMWVTGEGTRVYNRDNLSVLRLAFHDYAHADFALDGEDNEVILYHGTSSRQIQELGAPSGAALAMSRLSDGKKTLLLEIPWEITPHFSGLASRTHPGWVLVSTYTSVETAPQPFSREIFWLKLDGSGAARRIAHHHSDQAFHVGPSGEEEKDYFSEPQATSSWDGNIVLFSSVWHKPFARYDLYALTGRWW